jgi:hypothetical protein
MGESDGNGAGRIAWHLRQSFAPRWSSKAADAAARDEAVRPVLVEMQAKGMSSRAMAQALTERGHEPPRGGAWSYQTVLRMMERLGLKG